MTRVPVAIAHDYLTQRGGAERVVLALARAFPDAPIYTTMYDSDSTYPEFRNLDVRTSWLNQIPLARRHHRAALPLLPFASSSIEIDADVVIASSSGWSHGFGTSGRRLVYCYSPARWLYEPDRYLGETTPARIHKALSVLSPWLRRWDKRAAGEVDTYLAISSVTRDRIKRTYGRDATVVPAPHSVKGEVAAGSSRKIPQPGYFMVVSRLLPYKNVGEVVAAFSGRKDQRLVVVGAGPQKAALQAEATSNVVFLENLTDSELAACYIGCKALISASHEDFGLTPLEAAAYGRPSVVLRWGGFLDTVVEGSTGVFFDDPEPNKIAEALDAFENHLWDEACLRARAELFSEARFAEAIRHEISTMLNQSRGSHKAPS